METCTLSSLLRSFLCSSRCVCTVQHRATAAGRRHPDRRLLCAQSATDGLGALVSAAGVLHNGSTDRATDPNDVHSETSGDQSL